MSSKWLCLTYIYWFVSHMYLHGEDPWSNQCFSQDSLENYWTCHCTLHSPSLKFLGSTTVIAITICIINKIFILNHVHFCILRNNQILHGIIYLFILNRVYLFICTKLYKVQLKKYLKCKSIIICYFHFQNWMWQRWDDALPLGVVKGMSHVTWQRN